MTSSGAGLSSRRLDALTGIRFFAALFVFLSHTPRPDWLPGAVSRFMGAGYNGVTIFFILSGFVIAYTYFGAMRRPTVAGTWNYAVSRFARIYPLYFTVVVFVWLVQGSSSAAPLTWHLTALQAWSPDSTVAFALNAPGWSISVEFFLYACFPLVALALAPLARRPWALVGVAVAVVGLLFGIAAWFELAGLDIGGSDPASAHRWVYRTPLLRLGDFVVGAIVALIYLNIRDRAEPSPGGRVRSELLTWLPVLTIIGLMVWPGRGAIVARFDALWVVPTAVLYLALASYPKASLSRFLALAPVVLLGEASYAFYLIHRPVQLAFDTGAQANRQWWAYLLFTLLLLGLIAALSVGLHKLLETPARTLINKHLRLSERRPPKHVYRPTKPAPSIRPAVSTPVPVPQQTVPAGAPVSSV